MPDIFGCHVRPFTAAPDPKFFVRTSPHKSVFDALMRAIETGPTVAVVTGDGGSGKTLVARSILECCAAREGYRAVLLTDCHGTEDDVFMMIAHRLHGKEFRQADGWKSVVDAVKQAADQRITTVLLIDEAQVLSASAGNGLVRLVQHATAHHQSVCIVLFAQNEFRDTLKRGPFADLDRAVALRLHLDNLPRGKTNHFVMEMLHLAGAANPVFSDGAMQLIDTACRGNPRRIGRLCDILLFLAEGRGLNFIDETFTRHVLINNVSENNMTLTNPIFDLEIEELARTEDAPDRSDPVEPGRPTPAVPQPMNHLGDVAPAHVPQDSLPSRQMPNVATPPSARRWRGSAVGLVSAAAISGVALITTAMLLPKTSAPLHDLDGPVQVIAPVAATEPAIESATNAGLDMATSVAAAQDLEMEILPLATGTPQEAAANFAKAVSAEDPKQAAIRFTLAALYGHAKAAVYLSQLYATGDGVHYSPTLAARWAAVAEGQSDLAQIVATDAPRGGATQGDALFAQVSGELLVLVWDGAGNTFRVEIADVDGKIVGVFNTPLTAARIVFPTGANVWRVRADGAQVSAWSAIDKTGGLNSQ